VRIHVVETGRLVGNRTFMRADGWASGLLRRRTDCAFPVQSFLVEHPEGLLAIDTGLGVPPTVPRWQRRVVPVPVGGPRRIDQQMRAIGMDPADVRRVILTHLDWDHVGGVSAFGSAEVLVHRAEHEAATSLAGRMRYQPGRWPQGFSPTLYDLDDGPLGPFPRSRAVTERGDVHLVPLPGHSAGQVGVLVRAAEATLLFAADHVLRWDWFLEDSAAGRQLGLGIFLPHDARETSRRVRQLVEDAGAVVLPSHDDETPSRLARALRSGGPMVAPATP
jgi:glyoxylase-like metal-dependent hydrolase (beta-lactamase superfamily II)